MSEIGEGSLPIASRPSKVSTAEAIRDKGIFSWERVMPRLKEDVKKGKTLVITNGHFVMLHPGHSFGFEEARRAGAKKAGSDSAVDLLVIVNNDRQTKGKDPVKGTQNASERALGVLDNRHTDFVVISMGEGDQSVLGDMLLLEREGLLGENVIYVKGGDYDNGENRPSEAEIVEKNGGQFVIIDRVQGYSTTSTLNRMVEALRTKGGI
ncbi:MAG: hypothetical protein M1372_02085 [Patescibacteria group bacterium]|nr:hypothetical protein [Patescibacteria group bacterium]